MASLHHPTSPFLFPWPSNANNKHGLLLLLFLYLFLSVFHTFKVVLLHILDGFIIIRNTKITITHILARLELNHLIALRN